jgi:acetyl-CoA carboxylase beta subunit
MLFKRTGLIDGIPVALGLWTSFHGRHVQAVKGILLLIEYATKKGLTVILICASGGVQKVF